jgi:dTMP kinase
VAYAGRPTSDAVNASPYGDPIQRLVADPDRGHLDRAVAFAALLCARHGGDPDVIWAAVLLHDLDPDERRDILSAVAFPGPKVDAVAAATPDRTDRRPATLEARIVNDAVTLAGIAAGGLARCALWTVVGADSAELGDRLRREVPARVASLEFPESRQQAARDHVFVSLLSTAVSAPPAELPPMTPYVVFEGISGTGKSTQVDLLVARFARAGADPVVVREPTPWFRQARAALTPAADERTSQLALLLADRALNVAPTIREARTSGRPVAADRSFVSSMVYQAGEPGPSPAEIAYLHRLVPQPTSIILLDIEPEVALTRVDERIRSGRSTRGTHETLEQFVDHRERFLALTRVLPFMHVLDAQVEPEHLHEQVWQAVRHDTPGGATG